MSIASVKSPTIDLDYSRLGGLISPVVAKFMQSKCTASAALWQTGATLTPNVSISESPLSALTSHLR